MVSPVPRGWQPLIPYLVHPNTARALDFYQAAFGAELLDRVSEPDGSIVHSEVRIEGCVLLGGDARPEQGQRAPADLGGSPQSLYLYVADVDAAFARAVAAGATVREEPSDRFYGDRVCSFDDPSGHRWYVATHVRDLTPEQIAEAARGEGPGPA